MCTPIASISRAAAFFLYILYTSAVILDAILTGRRSIIREEAGRNLILWEVRQNMFELWLGGVVAFLLLAYLVYALLKPEEF